MSNKDIEGVVKAVPKRWLDELRQIAQASRDAGIPVTDEMVEYDYARYLLSVDRYAPAPVEPMPHLPHVEHMPLSYRALVLYNDGLRGKLIEQGKE